MPLLSLNMHFGAYKLKVKHLSFATITNNSTFTQYSKKHGYGVHRLRRIKTQQQNNLFDDAQVRVWRDDAFSHNVNVENLVGHAVGHAMLKRFAVRSLKYFKLILAKTRSEFWARLSRTFKQKII